MTINVIAKLEGGLGNQLFQYAIAKKISCDLNCHLILDIGVVTTQHDDRQLTLFNYKIDSTSISLDHNMSLHPKTAIEKFGLKDVDIIIEDKSLDVLRMASLISKSTYLIGWWQSYKYIESIKDTLRDEIYPKNTNDSSFNEAKFWIESKKNTVAIHVRRGDSIYNYGMLPKSYYFDAIKLLMGKISMPEIIYFSDDPVWVENELVTRYRGHIISSKWDLKVYEELALMSLCDHHIIANSTFSWWGCWLKKNENGISIRPSPWFGTFNDIVDEEKICPESWLIVNLTEKITTKSHTVYWWWRALKYRLSNYIAVLKFKGKNINFKNI
jgi:hypothetical protein